MLTHRRLKYPQHAIGTAGGAVVIGNLAQDAVIKRVAQGLVDHLVEQARQRNAMPPDGAILALALEEAIKNARPTTTVHGCPVGITCLPGREGDSLVHVVLKDAKDAANCEWATIRVQSKLPGPGDAFCLDKVDLKGSDLYGLDARGVAFKNCTFVGVEMAHSNLQGATLSQCSLQDTNLEHADCTGAKFSETSLFGTKLMDARLDRAEFRQCFVNAKTAMPEEMLPSSLRNPDDVIQPGDVLVTTSVLKLPSNIRQQTHVLHNDMPRYQSTFMRDAWFKAGLDQAGGKYTVMPGRTSANSDVYSTDWGMPQLHFESNPEVSIEGGNIFVLPNGTCVVGEESLSDRTSPDARERAIGNMREVLGAKVVVVLPQIFFHIDLHLTFLGDRWMIHSFDETVKFLNANRDSLVAKLGEKHFDTLLNANEKMAKEQEHSFVDHSIEMLKSTGYPVTKWCGSLFAEKVTGKNYPRVSSTFTNGVLVRGGPGQQSQYLVAQSDAVPKHREYVEDRCKELGLEVAYATIQLEDDEVDGATYASSVGAGVRCLLGHNPFGILNHGLRDE